MSSVASHFEIVNKPDTAIATRLPFPYAYRKARDGTSMAVQLEIILIAGVVALGLIVLGKALMTGFAISRRPSYHWAERTSASPVPPAVVASSVSDIRPPE